MPKNKEKIRMYYCTKCGTHVEDGDINCPKCNALLAIDGGTKSKVVTINEYRKIEEKEHPSFKLEKWYHYLFYVIGWIGVLNIIFWISMLWVYYKNNQRYDEFINPSTRKVVFIWGIIYAIVIPLNLLLSIWIFWGSF